MQLSLKNEAHPYQQLGTIKHLVMKKIVKTCPRVRASCAIGRDNLSQTTKTVRKSDTFQ